MSIYLLQCHLSSVIYFVVSLTIVLAIIAATFLSPAVSHCCMLDAYRNCCSLLDLNCSIEFRQLLHPAVLPQLCQVTSVFLYSLYDLFIFAYLTDIVILCHAVIESIACYGICIYFPVISCILTLNTVWSFLFIWLSIALPSPAGPKFILMRWFHACWSYCHSQLS